MASVVEIRGLIYPVDEVRSVTVDEVANVQGAFLQGPVRHQRCEQGFDSMIDRLVFAELDVPELISKCSDVILDLLTPLCEIIRQRRIDTRKILFKPLQLSAYLFVNLLK